MDRENCRLCYHRWRNADGHHRKMHGWSFSFSGLPYLTDIARITFIKRLKFRSENCPKTIYLLKACLQRLKLGLACVPLDCVLMYQDTFSVHRDLISWKSAAIIRDNRIMGCEIVIAWDLPPSDKWSSYFWKPYWSESWPYQKVVAWWRGIAYSTKIREIGSCLQLALWVVVTGYFCTGNGIDKRSEL